MEEDNFHLTYYHPRNMMATASNLLHFGLGQILRTTHLKDLEELKGLIVENGETTTKMDHDKIEKLKKFIFDGLIDSIRISICYENLIKAILLCNQYLVHVVDKNKDKELHKLQKSTPIKIGDYIKKYPPSRDENSKIDIIPNLTKNTLSFSEITGSGYQDIVKIPNEILEIVKPLYKKRNQIHFYNKDSFEYSAEIINDFDKLKKYSVGILIDLNNKLVKKLGGPQDRYIDSEKLKF
jgi:hypothetical protein